MRRPVRVVGLLAATLLVLAACSSAARTSPNTSPSPSAGSKADSAAPVTDPGPRTPCPATPSPPPPVPPAALPSGSPMPSDRVYAVDNHQQPGAAPATPALVDVIDPATQAVASSITIGAQPHHIYPVPRSNEAFVSHFVGCAMDVIDLGTNTVIGQVGTQFGPRHVAFDPSGRYAYAVDYYAASLSVLDTTTNHTVATVPTGEFPNYPQTSADGSLVFVVNSGSNTVTVAHAQAPFTVVATLTVGSHPFNLALTPDGRMMVVANAGDDTTSLIDNHEDPHPQAGRQRSRCPGPRDRGPCSWLAGRVTGLAAAQSLVAVVALEGTVIEGTRGWRAQAARGHLGCGSTPMSSTPPRQPERRREPGRLVLPRRGRADPRRWGVSIAGELAGDGARRHRARFSVIGHCQRRHVVHRPVLRHATITGSKSMTAWRK